MYVLFVVLNQPEHLGEVVRKLKDVGIHSATVIDSVGTARLRSSMGKEIPFIGSLMRSLDEVGDNNKTMFTVVESKKQALNIMDEIEKICGGDMSKPGTGIMFTIPIDTVRGGSLSRKNMDQMYKAE